MAAVQQRLQAHSRTRSGLSAPNTGTSSTSRPLVHQQPQHATPTISPLSLFLANLRLLDLDLLPDWPDVSPSTFATGTSTAQGQKKRIQTVEWALFQLFALWDPEETAKKLKPFFPPLDQVQSVNLRAALLRGLDQAKKNGVLGRDAVLRKTMLDECKGERLEEVLAAFSSAVLKKVVVDETAAGGQHPALALSLAVENKGYKDDKTDLSALILAHKVGLRKVRESREEHGARFRDFADLLGVKERGVARKHEEAKHREETATGKTVSEDARQEMRRTVRNNWSGNEKWMDTLLQGDSASKEDGPFGMPFDRVWRRVEQDRLGELEARDSGLLEQLDGRVRMHKERLEKWQSYRRNMFGDRPAPSPPKAKTQSRDKGIDLGFGAHENLRLGQMSPVKGTKGVGTRVTGEYRDLLEGLKSELAEADSKPNPLGFLQNRRKARRSSGTERVSEISELSDLEDELHQPESPPARSFSGHLDPMERPIRPRLTRPDQSYDEPTQDTSRPGTAETPSRASSHSRDINDSPSRYERTPTKPSVSPTQEAADQILESMNNTSPSPSKRSKPRHTLSLADRTRLSMAPRGSSLFLQDEDLESDPTLTAEPDTAVPDSSKTYLEDEPGDLVSRTRRSMAGFEKAQQKAHMERRRSQRRSKLPPQRKEGSYFPKLDEDEEQSALVEELGEEDMEAVFRSRPKIAASPLPSPTKEDFEDGFAY